MLERVYRAWLELESNGHVFGGIARSGQVEFQQDMAILTMTASGDLDAVIHNCKFEYVEQPELFATLVVKGDGSYYALGGLEGYTLQPQFPGQTKALANSVSPVDGSDSRPCSIINPDGAPTGDQIAIPGGDRITVSPDLRDRGIIVHCPVTFPAQATLIPGTTLGTVRVHMVGWREDDVYWIGISGCAPEKEEKPQPQPDDQRIVKLKLGSGVECKKLGVED